MKKIFLFAATAALFAACSSDSGVDSPQTVQTPTDGQEVGFSAYVNRGTTRAGQTGEQTLAILKQNTSSEAVGFGVFAYYTNADNYDQSFTPDFMYNQHVKWDGAKWDYTPKKYWPNEFGTNALSDDVDKISFFAYAPFVSVNPTSGKVKDNSANTYGEDDGEATMGIVGMKRNNDTGDPMIKYLSTFYTDEQVDLTWGTMNATGTWELKNTGTQPTTAGLPWLNMQHPNATSSSWGAAQKVTFDFKHALASLNVTVDTKTDGTANLTPDANTKVFVRSVTFEGFDVKGALNLNNAEAGTAFWYNFDCVNELNNGAEVTIKDGRKDGKEGLTAATKEYAAINPTFVQSAVFASSSAGVTGEEVNLFARYNNGGDVLSPLAKTDPIFVIPNNDNLKVTIEYDVLTVDPKLSGTLNDGQTAGSVVKNVITRYITSPSEAGDPSTGSLKLQNGKKYTIKLHLGLNSVQFDAQVSPWTADPDGGADLPHNN